VPQLQLGGQQQVVNPVTSALYHAPRGGLAKQGAEVYRSLGCAECHTEQVRGEGSDIARKWADRISVAQDYLGDYPVMLGAQRIGPDLANYGSRQTNAASILAYLYDPQSSQPNSKMPPYRFLFENQKPSREAIALAEYLMSLRLDTPLYEAPFPKTATNTTVAASTNAPATNSLPSTNVAPAAPSK